MAIKQEIAYSIIEAITDLRKGDDLEDFTVIVDGISVRCHKFILGACSLFFRALFRSGMKEDVENCVTLKTVSHPTFTLILSALYTGCDILTEENVTDIWRAAHLLEIGFLNNECENFIYQNISLDNFDDFYETAKLLDSEKILKSRNKFMIQNFDLLQKSQTLLNLSFSEINALITRDELVTNSEDNVVESILQWVSYNPQETSQEGLDIEVKQNMKEMAVHNENKDQENHINTNELSEEEPININNSNKGSETNMVADDNGGLHNTSDKGTRGTENVLQNTESHERVQDKIISTNGATVQNVAPVHKQTQTSMLPKGRQQHLFSLMSNARSCLLSLEYLEDLLSNPIIINDPKVRRIVFKAVHYHIQTGHRHGQWPSAAIHRSSSPFQNVLIWSRFSNYHDNYRYKPIHVRAFFSKDLKLQLTTKASSGKLIAFDNELYELNGEGLYVFRDDSWNKIVKCRLSAETFMIPLGNYIYFLNGKTKGLKAVNPKLTVPVVLDQPAFPGESSVKGAIKFQELILVFSSVFHEQTAVHCFNPRKKSWTKLGNMKGPAKDIISFHDDEKTFLLQTNGNLWGLTCDFGSLVKIVFLSKAWDFHLKLYGAAIFRKQLIIYSGKIPNAREVPYLVPELECWETASAYTVSTRICVTQLILPTRYLTAVNKQQIA